MFYSSYPPKKMVTLATETNDDPFHVTLVVKDGKEFKARGRVFSEGSPFFDRLLNSDVNES